MIFLSIEAASSAQFRTYDWQKNCVIFVLVRNVSIVIYYLALVKSVVTPTRMLKSHFYCV